MATTEDFKIKVTAQGLENLDKLSKGAENARQKVDGLASSILGVSFGAFIAGALNAADRISDLSDATGIAVVNVKAFETALETSGGKAKNVERALLGFSQSIETAADGSDKMREAFAKVGVSLTDLKNLSEQDLLQQTIKGLDQLKRSGASASEVASTGAQLLTKAFRGVDVSKFFADFESGKITLAGVASEIEKGAAANAKLEASYRNLQLGALQAIQPILDLMGEKTLTTQAAAKMVTFLGVALGLTFGAQMVARVIALNTAILGTAAAAALVGKNPLIKFIAGVGLTALGSGAALKAYDLALQEVEESQKKLAASAGTTPEGAPGSANRKIGLSASDKAAMESAKRTAQNIADAEKDIELRNAGEVEKISIDMRANIAKGAAEIRSKENLSVVQQTKEILSLVKKETEKAATEESKFRFEQYKKGSEVVLAQAEEDAKARAEFNKQQDQAILQAEAQVTAIQQGNNELKARLGLQASIQGLGTIDQERATKLFEIERARTEELRKLDAIKNLPETGIGSRSQREQEINDKLKERVALINQEYDTRQAREQDYGAGFKETMKRYEESLTPIKQGGMMAESVFSNMNSAIDKFATTGKFKFGDFARSVIQDMIKIELKAMASSLLRGLLGSIFGGLFGGGSAMAGASVLGLPAYANGGMVPAGQLSIVGEKGPELFLPNSSGRIVPNASMAGMGSNITNVTYSIQAVDASSFRQLVARDPSFIYAVTEAGRRSQPSRRLA